MTRLRLLLTIIGGLAIVLVTGQRGHASFAQIQRDQISVVVLVNVTPAPLTYDPVKSEGIDRSAGIALRMQMRARGGGAEGMPNFDIGDNVVAQAQSATRVQAEVSPNPNATLLYYNVPQVTINGTAGTTVVTPACAYTITVHTTSTISWTLDDGLSNDFSGATFPGNSLANNTYIQTATPQPTATPFVVYPNNNNSWFARAKGTGVQTYCVTLTLNIPRAVPGGAYSTNAVYTLYY
jgi:hypothetical protein